MKNTLLPIFLFLTLGCSTLKKSPSPLAFDALNKFTIGKTNKNTIALTLGKPFNEEHEELYLKWTYVLLGTPHQRAVFTFDKNELERFSKFIKDNSFLI